MRLIRDKSDIHCGKNFRIFRDAADETVPVTEFSKDINEKLNSVSYLGIFSYR
jgi:hypothetical protein